MILGVIFDFDNTIYNYDICNDNALKKVFQKISEFTKKDLEFIIDLYNNINKNIKSSNNVD